MSVFLASMSCSGGEQPPPDRVLVRVGEESIYVADFLDAFELAKFAYDREDLKRSNVVRIARQRCLNQLIEEQILLQEAEKRNIQVTDAELDTAVSSFQGNLSTEVFSELFLTQAVPQKLWRKQLRTRLIIEKLIREMRSPRANSSTDIALNPKEPSLPENSMGGGQTTAPSGADGETPFSVESWKNSRLSFERWMQSLLHDYPVQINAKQWEAISGFKSSGL